jgi:hypothetical protein
MKSGKRAYRLVWNPIDPTSTSLFVRAVDSEGKPIENYGLHIDLTKLSENNKKHAMAHGVKQTVGDEAAQSSGATLKQKWEALVERAKFLESGSDEWTPGRAAGEGTLLYRALMEENPKRDPEKTREIVAKMSERDRRALMNTDRLREIVDRLRGPSTVDTEKLFEELDAE